MRFLDLFSGIGGASMGIEWAGHEVVGAYDNDPKAVEVYNENNDWSQSLEVDLNAFDDFPEADAIWSSFPYRVFSRAKAPSKLLNPEKNGWFATEKAIDIVKPRVVILENIKSTLYHKSKCNAACSGCFFASRILPFLRYRYKHVAHRIINSADFGEPQVRRRLFVVAADYPIVWPKPTHSAEALWFSQFSSGEYWKEHSIPPTSKSHKTHQPDTKKRWRTIRDTIYDNTMHNLNDPPEYANEYYLDKPAPTLTPTEVKGTRGRHMYNSYGNAKPDRVSDYFWLAGWKRRVTLPEALRLQGFPGEFKLIGTKAQQYKQIGNSVVPTVVENIVRAACNKQLWKEKATWS